MSQGRFPPNLWLSHSVFCGDECHISCPVRLLDLQSGTLRARGNTTPTKRNGGSWFGAEGEPGAVDSGNVGGASRFFPTFHPLESHQVKENRLQVSSVVHSTVIEGDCVQVMREMDEASVDAIVCDPPYGLNFMGKEWDRPGSFVERKPIRSNKWDGVGGRHNPCNPQDSARTKRIEGQRFQEWCEVWAVEALRVLKPGGHLLAFGGTRTYHRMTCAIEDAGFEIRDCIQWIYGSGFPKSKSMKDIDRPELGTALKPAHEPIVMARKPLSESSVARQVLSNGCGSLNIDASRVGTTKDVPASVSRTAGNSLSGSVDGTLRHETGSEGGHNPNVGRWPSNLWLSHIGGPEGCRCIGEKRVKGAWGQSSERTESESWYGKGTKKDQDIGYADPDGMETVVDMECARDEFGNYICPVALLDEQGHKMGAHSAGNKTAKVNHQTGNEVYAGGWVPQNNNPDYYNSDGGSNVSRFFQQFHPDTHPGFIYQAKSSRAERNKGLEGMPEKPAGVMQDDNYKWTHDGKGNEINLNTKMQNSHPTVKALALMDYLVTLVCPPGGTVLDPFCGSGSTGASCMRKGFNFIGIEKEPEYCKIARRRIAYWSQPEEPKNGKPEPVKAPTKPPIPDSVDSLF